MFDGITDIAIVGCWFSCGMAIVSGVAKRASLTFDCVTVGCTQECGLGSSGRVKRVSVSSVACPRCELWSVTVILRSLSSAFHTFSAYRKR
jgi:hypothetical protein